MHIRSMKAAGLALTTSLLIIGLPAYAFPVVDVPHTTLTGSNAAASAAKWATELKHIGAEAAHWKAQIENMRNQLFALQSMPLVGIVASRDNFTRRPDTYGMGTTCARGESTGFDRLWQVMIPDLDDGLTKQQQELCQRIVLAENAKYNATVDLLLQLRKRDEELDKISTQRMRLGAGKQGDLVANSNQLELFATNMQVDLQRWATTVQSYDNLISSLKSEQRGIARRAFDGKPSPLGTAVGTVTLKAAIEAIR